MSNGRHHSLSARDDISLIRRREEGDWQMKKMRSSRWIKIQGTHDVRIFRSRKVNQRLFARERERERCAFDKCIRMGWQGWEEGMAGELRKFFWEARGQRWNYTVCRKKRVLSQVRRALLSTEGQWGQNRNYNPGGNMRKNRKMKIWQFTYVLVHKSQKPRQ